MRAAARVRLPDVAAVAVLCFLGVAGAIPGIAPNQASEMTGAPSSALQTLVGLGVQMLVDAGILCWMLHCRPLWTQWRARGGALPPLLVVSLGVWAVLSIAWSQDAWLTARRAVPFALQTMFGVFLVLRFRNEHLLRLLLAAFAVLAMASAMLAVGFPSLGLDASTGHAGDWQGVFSQKNACGRAMVFALAALLSLPGFSLARLALLLLFAGELLLSGSRGAWLLGLLVCVALLAFRLACRLEQRLRVAWIAGLAVATCLLGVFAYCDREALMPLIGRDATFTGRTAIWREVWLAVLRRPMLGYGFSAFWRGLQAPSWNVVAALRFVLFHAHNGFLEIWLELGGVGLLLFAAGFARGAARLWPRMAAGNYGVAAWPLAVLLLALLYDVDENTLLTFNGLFWPLYIAALARLELTPEPVRERVVNAPPAPFWRNSRDEVPQWL